MSEYGANDLADMLGLPRIAVPPLITETVRELRVTEDMLPSMKPAATLEDQLAREAAAAIERQEGFHGCAESRLRGAYDGDAEHRIALKAIELFTQSNRRPAEQAAGDERNG